MWYERVMAFTFTFINRNAYARSSDGINWTSVTGPGTDGAVLEWGESDNFDAATVTFPAVIKEEERFIMWYGGASDPNTNGLGCATSTDGINWTRISGKGPKGACFEAGLPSVIRQNEVYKMWYGIGGVSDIVNYASSEIIDAVVDFGNCNITVDFVLAQNYPNPFNQTTTIEYSLPRTAHLTMRIYNLLGHAVRTLVDEMQPPGVYRTQWNGKNSSGLDASTGLYVVRMVAGDFVKSQKILLMK